MRRLARVAKLDVMIALGTHHAMSEEAIVNGWRSRSMNAAASTRTWCFTITVGQPEMLRNIGTIPAATIGELSGGRFDMDVPVEINRTIYDYDLAMVLGPVFPHEVVGFSGGNKYLFPGISGPEVLNFFHWLGAVVTNPMIIGSKWTPVRKVVDHAAAMVDVEKTCFCMVVRPDKSLAGLFFGTPEGAWDAASDLSANEHITYKERPFHTIVSCAPKMYDDLWVGGKCMYKLEPVLTDGGELIIYAPHITEVSFSHGDIIKQIGYHCSAYLLHHWDRFKDFPWGLLAHSGHVKGIGTVDADGNEQPRATVTLATGIPEGCATRSISATSIIARSILRTTPIARMKACTSSAKPASGCITCVNAPTGPAVRTIDSRRPARHRGLMPSVSADQIRPFRRTVTSFPRPL